jgi:predicted AlkP superfamily pyrophosphatase or phosphodiesterase
MDIKLLMNKITKQKLVNYGVLIILIFGCIKAKEFAPVVEEKAKCTSGSPVRKVLIIGIDGCRTDALLAAHSPTFDSLMSHAYVNFNCDRGPYTVSGAGWSTILHGVFPAKHGIISNLIVPSNYTQYPDLFYYLRRFNPHFNLAVICNWEPFLEIVSNESYLECPYDPYDAAVGDNNVKTRAISLLDSCAPDVLLLHFDDVDTKGHQYGFSPFVPEYMNAITQIGNQTAEIMAAVKQREQNNGEEWLVFVVTDHGGKGFTHGGQDTIPQTRYVFEIARLPNQSRVDVPVANTTNIMPTILKYMGVPIDTAWGLDGNPIF